MLREYHIIAAYKMSRICDIVMLLVFDNNRKIKKKIIVEINNNEQYFLRMLTVYSSN